MRGAGVGPSAHAEKDLVLASKTLPFAEEGPRSISGLLPLAEEAIMFTLDPFPLAEEGVMLA